ncbi:hypothetical protein J6590_026729 [Homalodisca vitripennis]|nr:hypothetical protein J6590_026729 [Homalodisca vitripennis]
MTENTQGSSKRHAFLGSNEVRRSLSGLSVLAKTVNNVCHIKEYDTLFAGSEPNRVWPPFCSAFEVGAKLWILPPSPPLPFQRNSVKFWRRANLVVAILIVIGIVSGGLSHFDSL